MNKRGLRKNKKAQMNLSFGMIFSIMLIIFFLAFAFFGIKKLIEVQQETQLNLFAKDLQEDVDKLWNSNSGSNKLTYVLPTKAQKVCFENQEKNLIVYRKKEAPFSKEISHINMDETLRLYGEDIICLEPSNNKISFYIEKAYGDNFVVLTFEEN